MLTPPEKYEKFNVGARPMRMRECTTMNSNVICPSILETKHATKNLPTDNTITSNVLTDISQERNILPYPFKTAF